MTPIIASPHPNPDRRWSSTGDAGVRPNALNVYDLMLPSTVSTVATIPSPEFEARLDRLAATASNPIVRSSHADQSHFPHRRRRHPA
jgi:hypothetical protein